MQNKVMRALPDKKAARYVQLESKIRAYQDYDIAVAIPLGQVAVAPGGRLDFESITRRAKEDAARELQVRFARFQPCSLHFGSTADESRGEAYGSVHRSCIVLAHGFAFAVASMANAWLSGSIFDGRTTSRLMVSALMIMATSASARRGCVGLVAVHVLSPGHFCDCCSFDAVCRKAGFTISRKPCFARAWRCIVGRADGKLNRHATNARIPSRRGAVIATKRQMVDASGPVCTFAGRRHRTSRGRFSPLAI